ncbi:acyltransferase, partial [Paenibacillus sp. MCAF20]
MKFRTAAVQYQLEDINSFEQFSEQVTHYVRNASEYGAEFILFPEFMTTQLLSIPGADGKPQSIEQLPAYTDMYVELFRSLASEY